MEGRNSYFWRNFYFNRLQLTQEIWQASRDTGFFVPNWTFLYPDDLDAHSSSATLRITFIFCIVGCDSSQQRERRTPWLQIQLIYFWFIFQTLLDTFLTFKKIKIDSSWFTFFNNNHLATIFFHFFNIISLI